ncbi:MAG: PRC-barrel domain-containing protein, partial [Bacillota bacterium]|nr:PRC-barrel domain-containing protein [Bacillota bacterium]
LAAGKLLGLPVFSWRKSSFLGRVRQCYLDIKAGTLGGLVIEEGAFRRRKAYIGASKILKIYRDGIIVKDKNDVVWVRRLPQGEISLKDFLSRADLVYGEGEVISDLFFDDDLNIVGGEISGGFWRDISRGRGFCSWQKLSEKTKLQENGR